MNFKKRLRLYMFGFIFGCLFVLFIYNRKDSEFNYLPNDRVIGDFKKKNIYFDNSFYGLDTMKLLSNSKVIFSKSIINENDCNDYFLETEINKVQHSFIAISCTKEVRFKNLTISPD